MIIIKIFLILILTFGFVVFAFSSRLKILHKVSIVMGYFVMFLFIIYPKYSDKVAHFFSIGTGRDLIFYIAISLISLLSIIIYVSVRYNKTIITKIIRDGAIKNAKKCK